MVGLIVYAVVYQLLFFFRDMFSIKCTLLKRCSLTPRPTSTTSILINRSACVYYYCTRTMYIYIVVYGSYYGRHFDRVFGRKNTFFFWSLYDVVFGRVVFWMKRKQTPPYVYYTSRFLGRRLRKPNIIMIIYVKIGNSTPGVGYNMM